MAFEKGNIPWNKNKHISLETRKKISEANIGRKGYWLGKHHSEETKRKISESERGEKNHNYGKVFSKERRKKMSEAHKGYPISQKTRQKLSKIAKGKWHSPTYRKMMLGRQQKHWLSKEPTSIEKKVYDELKKRGLLFEKQKIIKGRFSVDAYIPSLNLVIEADGDYWHSFEKAKIRDRSKDAYLKTCGYNLLRLTETEINNNSFLDKLPVVEEK